MRWLESRLPCPALPCHSTSTRRTQDSTHRIPDLGVVLGPGDQGVRDLGLAQGLLGILQLGREGGERGGIGGLEALHHLGVHGRPGLLAVGGVEGGHVCGCVIG